MFQKRSISKLTHNSFNKFRFNKSLFSMNKCLHTIDKLFNKMLSFLIDSGIHMKVNHKEKIQKRNQSSKFYQTKRSKLNKLLKNKFAIA